MNRIDWEQMRSSPATIGAVRVAQFLGKWGSDVGKICFTPMFWYVAKHESDELKFAPVLQLWRTLINIIVVAVSSKSLLIEDKLSVPFNAHGVIFTLAAACLAGSTVDWVGLGLQTVGRKSRGT